MPLPHGLNNNNKNHQRGTKPPHKPLAHAAGSLGPSAQSDFSFSFMCKKTTLKTKRPAIMEKALA